MVEIIHCMVMKSTKDIVQKVKYIIVNYDEITIINNQSWWNVHAHIVSRL